MISQARVRNTLSLSVIGAAHVFYRCNQGPTGLHPVSIKCFETFGKHQEVALKQLAHEY